ncbi:MAG TPA: DUF4855 domain-containing protein, partial [Armatimonadota bacterium]|nr:DUF4855 domain-containing protein [Armatimonadota bacterium]
MTVLLIALLAAPSLAEYPTPEQAGFHHCMLIYDAATRDAAGMMPFVTHLSKRDRPTEWLFDAFLFCAQGSGPSTEASYMNGPTNQADWQAMLEPWFSPEHGFPALQAAVDQAETRLGPIPKPLQIIITIPYPSISQTDFGDVDGDGVSEDLTDADDFTEAISWYLDLATRRFDEADLPDLELWGFYWTWEGIAGADGANALLTSEIVHERGRRLLWIPWYRASGWESWRDFGFDVAIMQPNYAFLTYHRDAIRNDRLVDNAEAARAHGLGVEM